MYTVLCLMLATASGVVVGRGAVQQSRSSKVQKGFVNDMLATGTWSPLNSAFAQDIPHKQAKPAKRCNTKKKASRGQGGKEIVSFVNDPHKIF